MIKRTFARRIRDCRWLAVLLGVVIIGAVQAAEVTLSPPSVNGEHIGLLTITVTGVANGQTVAVRKYLDVDANGVIDGGEPLTQAFRATDGQAPSIGGVRFASVPGDEDGAQNGRIRVELDFWSQSEINRGIGHCVYQVSAPDSAFAPITIPFSVTAPAHAQQVTGQVTAGGSPVAHAYVFLITGGRGGPSVAALADAQGRFALPCLPGMYGVGAVGAGLVMDFSSMPMVSVDEGANVTRDLTLLTADRTISGRVVDAATADGIPAVQMVAESDAGLLALAVGDVDGRFTVPVVSGNGQWDLDASERDLLLHRHVDLESITVDTSQGDVTDVLIELPRATALIYGYLKDQASDPIPGLELWADWQDYETECIIRADGSYSMGVLPGQWWVGADSDLLSQSGYTLAEQQAILTVNQALRLDFTATQATAHLRGRAFDGLANPLGGVTMRAISQTGANSVTFTGADGSFDLGVSAGVWRLEMSGDEAQERGLVRPIYWQYDVVDGVDHNDITYVAPYRTAEILCSIRDAEGTPVSGVGMSAEATIGSTSYVMSDDTDLEGTCRLNAINGAWTIYVYSNDLLARGYAPVSPESVLVSGQDASVFITVQPAIPLQITTSSLPGATLGQFYNVTLFAVGGQWPYYWSSAPGSGPLPGGMELASNGTLWGTPSAVGTFAFGVRVTDGLGTFADQPLSLAVMGEGPNLRAPELLPGGSFRFRIESANAGTCSILVSTNLSEWSPLGPAVAEGGGIWTYTDSDARTHPRRFYRAVVSPP